MAPHSMVSALRPSAMLAHGKLPGAGAHTEQGELHHGAVIMGLAYGLVHVLGPDHLGTLATLSSVTSPANAFRVGAAWGLGHSFGMMVIAVISIALHQVVHMDLELWEYWGNYAIGASMIMCSLYFIFFESRFLKQNEDGTFVPQPCACHGPVQSLHDSRIETRPRSRRSEPAGRTAQFCAAYATEDSPCCNGSPGAAAHACSKNSADCEDREETEPLLPRQPGKENVPEDRGQTNYWQQGWSERNFKGAILGILQGFCCPLGVVGIGFVAGMPAHGVVVFLLIFMIISTFGTASLAVVWASLTANGFGRCVSPQVVYRVSCSVTMILGIAWIIANFFGIMARLDYTESFHHR